MDKPTLYQLLKYALRIAYVIITNIMAIPSYITWHLVLYPVRALAPDLYWTSIEPVLFKGLIGYVCIWTSTGGYNMEESGDSLDTVVNSKTIFIVNHQSTSDVPVVMSSLHPKQLASGHMMWIMDFVFKYTNFGWISVFHGDFFLQQGKEYRNDMLGKLKKHLQEIYNTTHKKWIILFPEGGFLRKRRKTSHLFAQKNNLPVLNHVTLPRVGALQTLTDTLNPKHTTNGVSPGSKEKNDGVEFIVDMTIGYPKAEALDLHGICIGYWAPRNIAVHYRIYPINKVPIDDTDKFTSWLYDRYVEKEAILEEFYTKDKPLDVTDKEVRGFPRMKRRIITFDILGLIWFHFFYAASAYIFWTYLYIPAFSVVSYMLSFVF